MDIGNIIAGPCSAESREQVLQTAEKLHNLGIKTYRAGLWKPRTHPGSFEGVGREGLPWLKEVERLYGMTVTTEVANSAHAEDCLDAGLRMMWIGARTTANPFAVQEIADAMRASASDVTVIVKNPISPDIELWCGAIQRLRNAGIDNIIACHRGFSRYGETHYRNTPLWSIPIEMKRRHPEIPLYCDPSHIAGKAELVPHLSQTAADMGYSGLMIECHCNPSVALSDSAQQLSPEQLKELIDSLKIRSDAVPSNRLDMLRKDIDDCDRELIEILARRMEVSREIGKYKKDHNMTVVQISRHDEIMRERLRLSSELGLSVSFVSKLLAAIHEESVDCQIKVLNE